VLEVVGDRVLVKGPMLIGTVTALREAGDAALAGGIGVVDLSRVSDADSSAVALLLAWTRDATQRQSPLSIVEVPDSIRSLASLYGVADLLPLA
jgi:phospholipid transport system transporter-binding protein